MLHLNWTAKYPIPLPFFFFYFLFNSILLFAFFPLLLKCMLLVSVLFLCQVLRFLFSFRTSLVQILKLECIISEFNRFILAFLIKIATTLVAFLIHIGFYDDFSLFHVFLFLTLQFSDRLMCLCFYCMFSCIVLNNYIVDSSVQYVRLLFFKK